MIRLTKPQRTLLEQVAQHKGGREIATRDNRPLQALLDHGLLEQTEKGNWSPPTSWYRITPAGTAFLEGNR